MNEPPVGPPPQHTAPRTALSRGPVLVLVLLVLACRGASGPLPAPEAAEPGAARLEVRLLFGGDADLDLHVTDPRQETIYFANSPAVSGGRLEADQRCGDPAPRSERVVFERPPPGRYRVGVDFPIRCDRRLRGPVPYLLQVEGPGLRQLERGRIEFGRFEAVALEFEVGE